MAQIVNRPMRADAQRNRARLLEAAVRAFSQEGPEVTLDAITRNAGVGIGTLYRHFPPARPWWKPPTATSWPGSATRSRSCSGTWAAEATRRWMDRFVDYMTTKRGMADALRAVIASGRNPHEQTAAS